jgi:hypothetical protein
MVYIKIIAGKEKNKMTTQIYLLCSELGRFERDLTYASKIAELHRQKPLNVVFMNQEGFYPIVEDYCSQNQTQLISVEKRDFISSMDIFLSMFTYSQNHPKESRLVNIINAPELEELIDFFKQTEFNVEGIVV